MQSESSNIESVDIKTDYEDETPKLDSVASSTSNNINNISVLNELQSMSQLSLETADSVDVCSQYQDINIQTPRLLDNNYTPKSTLSEMSSIPNNPASMTPLPPSARPRIISSNQHNNYSYQQHHFVPHTYNNYINRVVPQYIYSTKQISCPGKNNCPDTDCMYGHASPYDRQKGEQLFCERIADCPYGSNCSRYHVITWNGHNPPKELQCPFYYNRKHRGYCKGYKASKCPYYHGRLDEIRTQQWLQNNESKSESESSVLTHNLYKNVTPTVTDYVLYSHGYYTINRQIYKTKEEVYSVIKVKGKKSYVAVNGGKIIMENQLDHWKLQWFYMCIGEAVFDGLLQIPSINHYCIVWHANNQCHDQEFGVNDIEVKKCKQRYNELKQYATSIIYNGKSIQQRIVDKKGRIINNGVNEWLKAAVGSYYYRFLSH